MALLLEKISEAMQHNEEMKKGLMKSILMLMMEWKSFEGNLDLTAKCLKQCFNELETKDQHLASVQESVVESSKELNLIRESVEQKRKEVEGKEEEFRAFRDREIRDLECKWKDFTLVKTEFDEAVKLREVKLNDQEKKGELLLGEIELGRKRLEDTFTEISMKENEFEERSKKMNKILTRIREESDSLHLKERKFAEQVDEFQMKQKLFHSMEKELESKERNLDFARKELVVKENSLKKEVREKEHILDSIQKELMEKETNFDLVKNELKGKVTHLSSQLTIKEEHLSTMKKELELKDESLDTVKRKLEFQEQDLNSLKERLQLREGECDSVIEVYRKRLEELDSREKMVEQLRVESEFKLKQLERLGKSMEKRFKHISMKEENFGKYRVSKKVQSWILEKSNALDERLEEVQIKEKILESTKKDLETKQRSLDSWRKELTIMESYLDSVKKDLGVKEDVAQFQVHDISQVQEPMTRKRLASDSEDVSVHEPLQQHWNFKRLYQLPIHAEIGQEANIDSNSLPSSAQSSSQATAATIHSTKLFIAGPSDNTEARPSVSGQSPEREQKPVATAPETTNEKSPILSGTIGKESKEMFRHFMLNMPCVSTKGDGPNEKKIEGFLYGYNKGEDVKIVCVCHGTFLSPAEFVKHAGGGDVEHPLRHIVTNPSPLL